MIRFVVIGNADHDLIQNTADLPDVSHAPKIFGEYTLMLRHRFGKKQTRFYVFIYPSQNALEKSSVGLIFEYLQAIDDRNACINHNGKLSAKHREFLDGNSARRRQKGARRSLGNNFRFHKIESLFGKLFAQSRFIFRKKSAGKFHFIEVDRGIFEFLHLLSFSFRHIGFQMRLIYAKVRYTKKKAYPRKAAQEGYPPSKTGQTDIPYPFRIL